VPYDFIDDLVDVDLTRYVRTPAGVKRYHKPVGSPIGGGSVESHVRRPMSKVDQQYMEMLNSLIAQGRADVHADTDPDTIASLLKQADKTTNKIPSLLKDLPEGWKPVNGQALAHLFPDDPQRTADFLQGLDKDFPGGPSGGAVVIANGRGAIVQVNLPTELREMEHGAQIDQEMKDALSEYPDGIKRMARGAEWATDASRRAPGTGKSPVVVTAIEPARWDMQQGVMGYTRMDAPDYVSMNPDLLMTPGYENETDVDINSEGGWFSPAGRHAPVFEGYLILHEFGHVNDARMRDTYGPEADPHDYDTPGSEAKALFSTHKPNADRYGQSSEFEMYAEAFAEWYGDQGPEVNPGPYPPEVLEAMKKAAADYAKKYGWTR
jgi:hypothetical protein